jgi:hypothetical protein
MGPMWSPYFEDAKKMSMEDANSALNAVCNNTAGAKIVPCDAALKEDARKHKGGQEYEMRAKYLAVGAVIAIPGHAGTYEVIKMDDKEFTLSNQQKNRSKMYLSRASEAWVRVFENKVSEAFKA